METLEQQQPGPLKDNMRRVKIVLKNKQGKTKDARITNIDQTVTQFSDFKTQVVSHFLELEKKEYVIGWIDEEQDYVAIDSDEEYKVALAATKGGMLKIHLKIKQNRENVAGKGQTDNKVQLPRQYFTNLLAARQNMSGPGSAVLHSQNFEGMRNVIRKHPGVLFIGGDWKQEIGTVGEKKIETQKKQEQEKIAQKKQMVNRIIGPPKAIALLQDMKSPNDKEDAKKLSFLFVPIIAGRKQQHCHVFGTWEESMEICVAFKRRGEGGQKEVNTGGKLKLDMQNSGNDEGKPGNMKNEGEQLQRKLKSGNSQNVCFVDRKRIKMIASRIFKKIDPTIDNKVPLPRQYFTNLLVVRQNMSDPGSVLLHNQNFEGMRNVIKKHPGVIFIGGDWKQEIGIVEEKKKQILKNKNQGPKKMAQKKQMNLIGEKNINGSQNLRVNRIIGPPKAIALLRDMKNENNKENGKKLSFLFVPIIAGRKQQHCHIFGTWEESMEICVAFKRTGEGGQKEGNTDGKLKMEMQNFGKKEEKPDNMKNEEEQLQRKPNSGTPQNMCFVTRKRMKIIASRIFKKIDPSPAVESAPL